jgi:hypothetical protein
VPASSSGPRRTSSRSTSANAGADPREDIDHRDSTRVVLRNDETDGTIVRRRSALRSLGEGWVEVAEVGDRPEAEALAEARRGSKSTSKPASDAGDGETGSGAASTGSES